MLLRYRNPLRVIAFIVLASLIISVAHAEDEDDEGGRLPVATNAQWQKECSACHVAYPPRMLPASSWRAVMAGLDKHFGSDASLTPTEVKEIGAFLEKNAGSNRHASSGKPILRITKTRWFIHEHDEVSDRTWKNPKVKSPANCGACHTQSGKGIYSEHGIKIPV
jgi:hypothetical protein